MDAQGRNYLANHVAAPQILQGTPNFNVEVSEGMNPPGEFYPASWLPTVISENRIGGAGYVLMPGKVITLDQNKRLVPMGLAASAIQANAGTGKTYSKDDVSYGFTNAAGAHIQEGDFVVDGILDAANNYAANLSAMEPIGIMRYSSLMAPGSDPSDPSTFWRHAYDTGGARAFSRWGYIQVPVVEVNEREEKIVVDAAHANKVTDHRILLWPNGDPAFYVGGTQVILKKVYKITEFAAPAVAGTPDQFTMIGRTIFFNATVPANWTVRYTPVVDLPFCHLVSPVTGLITSGTQIQDVLNQKVTFDDGSNFKIAAPGDARIGRVLDVKAGSSSDLALVRTYYRDFGLWQEGPGSSTDGRNAMLSITNAPKWIARIAVNFNVPSF